jgi:D-ribose pyranase
MIKNGIINGDLASLLARFRHVNTIAIVDGPFPTYPGVETIDLALVMGTPTVCQVLDAILPHLDLTGMFLAAEFEAKVDAATVAEYKKHYGGLPTTIIAHEDFKVKVGQALGIIHTGDAVPYSSVILKSG